MEIIFEPQTAHLTIISVNDCRSDPDECLYEHKTPTVSLFVNMQGPLSLLRVCVCVCVYVWLEGKNPLQSTVVDDGAETDYVGEEG